MDVAKQPGLMRRKARWYIRVRTPRDLVPFLGRSEIWQSLRTGEHAVAIKRYRRARADLDAWFDQQRRRRDAGERLNGEAPRLVASWLHEQDRRAAHADFGLAGEMLRSAQGEAGQELADLLDGEAGEAILAAVDKVLMGNGWPARAHAVGAISTRRVRVADAPDEHREALVEPVRRALVEAARRRIDRLNGQPPQTRDLLFNRAVHPVAPNGQDPDAGLTLAELVERFAAERGPAMRDKTNVDYGMLWRVLRELWGEAKPVRAITRADCRAVRDLFASLPANCEKRFRRMTLAQAAEHARAHNIAPMSPRNANKHVRRLSTFLRWAEREEYIPRNVAVGLSVAAPDHDPKDARHPFSLDQLQRIFGPEFVDLSGAKRWIPLVALFTGARLNEICALDVDDVAERDGVPVFMVEPDTENGGRLKTTSSRRIIPVHPTLAALGFLGYVERQRRAGHAKLFPELKQDARGYYSDAYQKWFSRYLDKCGAKASKTSFHSFRHCFRDGLREADIPRDAALALGGWKPQTVDELYGGGLRPATLAREIAKIEYDGLDLGHLRVP